MTVLAFDCSSPMGSVAVIEGRAVRFVREFDSPRGRGGGLFPALEAALNIGKPEKIVVGLGPGSYNGLRVAIATAFGLQRATGAALAGVSSLLALPCKGDYAAVGDARGSMCYFARVADRAFADGPMLVSAADLRERLSALPALPVLAPAAIPEFSQAVVVCPSAEILGRLGSKASLASGALEPIYLKPPHITTPRARPDLRSPGGSPNKEGPRE